MHYVRNIICFMVIAFVGCIFYLNTSGGNAHVKEWLQIHIKSTHGIDVDIGALEFDLPRSIVLEDVFIQETPYGPLKVDKITLTAPLLKLLFGRLSEGTVHFEGLAAENPALASMPSNLRTYVSWDVEHQALEGKIDLLESKNDEFPYQLLDKGLFKIYLTNDSTIALDCYIDQFKVQDYFIEGISSQANWNKVTHEGQFSVSASQVDHDNFLSSEASLKVKDINCNGLWNDDERKGHINVLVDKVKEKSLQLPNSLFYAHGLMIAGDWDANQEIGRFAFSANEIDDKGLLLPNSTVSAEGFAGRGGWDSQQQTVHFSFSTKEIDHKGFLNPNSPVLSNGIMGHGDWNLQHHTGGFSLAVEELLEEHISIANATIDISTEGSSKNWKYEITSEGVYEDSFVVALSGALSLDEELCHFELNRFNGTLAKHTLSLVDPLKCALGKDLSFEISQSHFVINGKEFRLSGQGNKDDVDFRLQLPKQPIDQLALGEITAPPFTGMVSGELSMQGPYTGLQGKLSLALDNVSIDHPSIDKTSQFGLQLSAILANDSVTLSGALEDNTVRLLELQGFCPVEKSGYCLIEPSRVQEMALNIFGEIDLARYIHTMVPPTVWATGQSAVDVQLTGFFEAPELRGNIKLIDGNFELWKTGTLLHHINADFYLSNDKILLHSLSAYDAQGGTVTALGELDLTSALDYPFHVDLAVNRTSITDIDNMQAVLSGAMTFVGNLKGATLKGELTTDRLDFPLKDESSSIDHDIEVNYVNQSIHEAPPTQPSKPAAKWPICFDLHIKNRENILIHSEEFASEWKGDVKVTGCNTQPLLNGDFRIIQGNFSLPDYLFPGKKFKITQGTISFAGELNKKTTLYIVGEMEVEHIVAQVIVKGPLSNPSLAFRSNPPLSQREILSWILFGRGMEGITPFQGAELTQSINQLKRSGSNAGNKNSTFLSNLTRLKENLGIDRIGIDRTNDKDGNEEISLQVGKYIMPEVFLGFKRNMSTDVNRFGLEANLRKNLKLQAEVGVGEDTDGQLHLKWKHDY